MSFFNKEKTWQNKKIVLTNNLRHPEWLYIAAQWQVVDIEQNVIGVRTPMYFSWTERADLLTVGMRTNEVEHFKVETRHQS